MINSYLSYQKDKEFLLCVDSDGCVMDAMDMKHILCFAPCVVEEWGLDDFAQEVLADWNHINLYSMTRGMNRFKALACVLERVNEAYQPIKDIEHLVAWTGQESVLSEDSLKKQILKTESPCLTQALHWSQEVNRRISHLPNEKIVPFEGAKEALEHLYKTFDIAIVSSANYEAVVEEWRRFGLMEYVDIILAQNAGSKVQCIKDMLAFGYDKKHVLMIGDAPGDLEAALENGVFFYPILTAIEKESWQEVAEAALRIQNGTYEGAYQEQKQKEFIQNLNE